jgi:hypothetical protein
MTLDNSKTIIGQRIKIFAVTVLLLAYIVLTYIAELIKYPVLGMSDSFWTMLLVGLYFLYAIYPMVLNYQYLFYSDEEDTIVFRYFMAGIFGGRKNSIKISKENFAGYKIESRYFGMKLSLILYQQMREGVASYPPVYISNLTKEERAKVLNSLYLHTPEKLKDISFSHE